SGRERDDITHGLDGIVLGRAYGRNHSGRHRTCVHQPTTCFDRTAHFAPPRQGTATMDEPPPPGLPSGSRARRHEAVRYAYLDTIAPSRMVDAARRGEPGACPGVRAADPAVDNAVVMNVGGSLPLRAVTRAR